MQRCSEYRHIKGFFREKSEKHVSNLNTKSSELDILPTPPIKAYLNDLLRINKGV